MGGGDISGRWSQQQSYTNPGFAKGDAFKGNEYLYNTKTGMYGTTAGRREGIYPQQPEGILPVLQKIPTTNYAADPVVLWKDYYEHQRKMILLNPYTDNAPYGI